jgi:hypothetical protein
MVLCSPSPLGLPRNEIEVDTVDEVFL